MIVHLNAIESRSRLVLAGATTPYNSGAVLISFFIHGFTNSGTSGKWRDA